ncbi:TetR/AcrR family transcriptional regulator [Actinomadura rugatobispora]|uniref:TetR/AcrR family transcriptional regulator n=1 Tax=Actinomadura rugatobispora TaxID=1994 RepID=A0ABW1A937_9ACTN
MMMRSPALRDHVATGLLETAAAVLAERGESASMTDIAEAAGVARATLYRYFPNREALRQALYDAAFADLTARVADAGLDTATVPEGLARLTRAFVGAAGKWRALELFHKTPGDARKLDRELIEPMRGLFERGAAEGSFRGDVSVATMIEIYVALLEGAVSRVIRGRLGVEEASSAITAIFLNGVLDSPDR